MNKDYGFKMVYKKSNITFAESLINEISNDENYAELLIEEISN